MPNLSGVSPLTIKLTDAILNLASQFKPGKAYPGIVHITPKGAQVQVAGTHIPLPQASTLPAGQSVTVTYQSGTEGAKLVILPTPQPPATPASVHSAPLALLKTLMEELPILKGLSPQQVATLSPTQLPQTETVLRMALQIFEFRATTQEAVKHLMQALEMIQNAGVKSPMLTKVLELLGTEIKMEDPKSVLRFLKTLQTHTSGLPVPTSGDTSFEESLYALLGKLRNDPALTTALESKGALTTFQHAVDTLMDHFAGQYLQNVRSTEVPYAYLNIPFPEDSGILQAQIHVLGEGHGENEWDETGHSQIVLDLQTTRLGELWIQISHRPEQCVCQFEVESDAIVNRINEVSDDLQSRLEAQGFQQVTVQASLRSNERMEAVARLLQRYSGLDMQA